MGYLSRAFGVISWLIGVASPFAGAAATLDVGVVGPNLKVRPTDRPALAAEARLWAGRNEFEPFQIVLTSRGGPTTAVTARLARALTSACGDVIPDGNVTLYRQVYHPIDVPSHGTGGAGAWPDALIPDVDPYLGQRRNAFPFDVPAEETRAIWVDVLVPIDAAPATYSGAIEISAGGRVVGSVPIRLVVGTFTLPSTATLASAYFLEWNEPCHAHTGTHSCGPDFNVLRGTQRRALYVRAALEHRFTIASPHFQPPFGGGAEPFARVILPYIDGTAPTRLPGARLTTISMDNDPTTREAWLAYAERAGFIDRLMSYPVDEPGNRQAEWNRLVASADALRRHGPTARTIITSTIQEADAHGARAAVDIFAPIINHLDNKPRTGYFEGYQLDAYAAWRAGDPRRRLWSYESCASHGCGTCGTAHPDPYYEGWPQKVIDVPAVSNRCFPWLAFRFGIEGELYSDVGKRLKTAWERDGLCFISGNGDGTLFYPGKPAVIGGRDDIPVESIRMKMIREGMEDYEYFQLARSRHGEVVMRLARQTMPRAYSCGLSAEELETVRLKLFQWLDQPTTATCRAG